MISFSVFTKESHEIVSANSFKEETKQDDILSDDMSPTKKVLENNLDSPTKRKKRKRKADKLSDRRAKVEDHTLN